MPIRRLPDYETSKQLIGPASPELLRTPLIRLPRGHPRPLLQIRRWLRILGPGLVTDAADDDPSGIGTYSQAGATFGTGQLWLALYMLPLLIVVVVAGDVRSYRLGNR